MNCEDCKGTGRDTCPGCCGTGREYSRGICIDCAGRGSFTCFRCTGTGERLTSRKALRYTGAANATANADKEKKHDS